LVIRMPEPMQLPQRRVCFGWTPAEIAEPVHHIPIRLLRQPTLIAYPSDVAVFQESDIRKNQCILLIGAKRLDVTVEVVNVTGAARAIEPELNQVTIVAGKFFKLLTVMHVIRRVVFVRWLMPVPG